MLEYGTVVDGGEVGTCDGIIRIVYGGKSVEVVLTANGDESDVFVTLNDCLEICCYDEECPVSVIVIIDDWTHGVIYRYGAYCEKRWEIYGETKGFA